MKRGLAVELEFGEWICIVALFVLWVGGAFVVGWLIF